jgi:hypothetical protein
MSGPGDGAVYNDCPSGRRRRHDYSVSGSGRRRSGVIVVNVFTSAKDEYSGTGTSIKNRFHKDTSSPQWVIFVYKTRKNSRVLIFQKSIE